MAIETEIQRCHELSDEQFAAYSRRCEQRRELDQIKHRQTLAEHAELILEHRPKSRSIYPAKVLKLAADAIRLVEEAGLSTALSRDENLITLTLALLSDAGIELDEFEL